jgi:hypothetical protein
MTDSTDTHGNIADGPALKAVTDMGGLPVEDASGLRAGTLFGSIVESDSGLIRYIDLDLAAVERHVLVPIGHARIGEHREGPRVRLRAALLEELEGIPPYPAEVDHIDDPFERSLLEAYGRTFHGERYYAHPSYDHDGVYTGDHPVEAETPDGTEGDAPLCRLAYMPGWRVASGEPDIRGWPLALDGNGSFVVRDLIVDRAARKVRYIVAAAADGPATRLLPVGFLRVDAARRRVTADALDDADLTALPPYDGGGVSREQEDRLAAAIRRQVSRRRRYRLPDYRSPASRDGGTPRA